MTSNFSRRTFLEAGAGFAFAALRLEAKERAKFKIGVTDWNLKETGKIEAVALAKSLGFAGVQVSLGRDAKNGRLPMDNPELEEQYLRAAKTQDIALAGTCLDILHVNCLMNDKLAQKWVADGIPITKKLNAKVMLLPFFGKCALKTAQERDYVGDALKELAPEAERQNVLLGLEDPISAEDNVRIMERAKSPAVLVYYDVGNSTKNGFDVPKEIRWLGKQRICQIHLKDQGYIGQGPINFEEVMKAIVDIGYDGFCNLETNSPSGSIESDMRRNLAAVREFTRKAENA
jgi:sugar phosphate isomerase/epimerase